MEVASRISKPQRESRHESILSRNCCMQGTSSFTYSDDVPDDSVVIYTSSDCTGQSTTGVALADADNGCAGGTVAKGQQGRVVGTPIASTPYNDNVNSLRYVAPECRCSSLDGSPPPPAGVSLLCTRLRHGTSPWTKCRLEHSLILMNVLMYSHPHAPLP